MKFKIAKIMKRTFLIFSVILIAIFSSCKQNVNAIDPQNPLIGTWVYKNYEQIDSTQYAIVYERKIKFDENNPGFFFKVNNQLVERKNVGWCGTPPISYGEYNGSYTLNDKQITIESDGWNGKMISRYEVTSIDDKILKIKQLN
jgi:hypothetical protein